MRFLVVLLAPALALAACVHPSSAGRAEHPANLVGRWVRLREDQSWGDTLVYLATGQVLGSTGHAVPSSARWWVKTDATGTSLFCAADEKEGYCQTFRLEGDRLILSTPPGPTIFRRVPERA